jgi:hypothetical protein
MIGHSLAELNTTLPYRREDPLLLARAFSTKICQNETMRLKIVLRTPGTKKRGMQAQESPEMDNHLRLVSPQ